VKELLIRRALREDVAAIVRLLADDHLGSAREKITDPLPESYLLAFEEINRDPRQELIVAQSEESVIGCMQLTIIPGLSNQGARRAQIEAVRVDAHLRNKGIGEQLIKYAIERARYHGCKVVQLTTHQSRTNAHRFYERLGFHHTHLGFKLSVD